jgi:hypothetical protein
VALAPETVAAFTLQDGIKKRSKPAGSYAQSPLILLSEADWFLHKICDDSFPQAQVYHYKNQ